MVEAEVATLLEEETEWICRDLSGKVTDKETEMLINRIDLPIRTLHIRAKKGRYKFQI